MRMRTKKKRKRRKNEEDATLPATGGDDDQDTFAMAPKFRRSFAPKKRRHEEDMLTAHGDFAEATEALAKSCEAMQEYITKLHRGQIIEVVRTIVVDDAADEAAHSESYSNQTDESTSDNSDELEELPAGGGQEQQISATGESEADA